MCWCASMRRLAWPSTMIVLLNGQNRTGAFRPEAGRRSLLGLVDGLTIGQNSLVAKAIGPNNETYRSANLVLINYPITGPILSGPHEEPFYCMTQLFTLPASTNTLGPAARFLIERNRSRLIKTVLSNLVNPRRLIARDCDRDQ